MNYKYAGKIYDECELEDLYKDWLDEVWEEVAIGNLTFSPSKIIEELDPTAFRVGMADWMDSEDITEFDEDENEEGDE